VCAVPSTVQQCWPVAPHDAVKVSGRLMLQCEMMSSLQVYCCMQAAAVLPGCTLSPKFASTAPVAWISSTKSPDGPDGPALTVPMMRGTATRSYLRGDGYQAVLLPYRDIGLAMAVLLPNGPLTALRPKVAAAGRRLQTGFVRSYALSMFFGAVVVVALLLAVRL